MFTGKKNFKFVNREEKINKNIKTLVKYTFCDSNFLRNLFFQFITIIQLEIFTSKGQKPKFQNPEFRVINNKIPKIRNANYLQQLRRTFPTSILFY